MTLRPSLNLLLDQFGWGRVLVVGDVIADEWLSGSCAHIAREAPVPTVAVRYREVVPGGAGNTAVNVAALGGRARLLTTVGTDLVGEAVTHQLERRGVEVSALEVSGRATVAKRRITVGHQVVARFDEGDTHPVGSAQDEELAERLGVLGCDADAVVVADYGLGTLAGPAVRAAVAALPCPVLIDAHDVRTWRDAGPVVVTPNWQETSEILQVDPAVSGARRLELLESRAAHLRSATGSAYIVATLDGDGAALVDASGVRHIPTRRVDDPHSAGAGDTLAAALALGLAVGAGMADAVEVAVAAASVVVQRPGTAACSVQDLRAAPDGALLTPERLVEVCHEHRAAGRTLAVTNGCFDVLHAGHLALLQAAAAEADVLVVALNSDAGVRAIKGPGRPVNGVEDRAALLAAMGFVDHVVAFDGSSPLALLEALRPDVYVKGADHDVPALPEARATAALGGRICVVPLLPDRSTSNVIEACAHAQRSSA
jgi:rfaE bifunctional protein kinase chain/domain/rfaE bifunctional protein nucleotidyltransferase chain/domain